MSNPTLAYKVPERSHDIRLGWLAAGAIVMMVPPVVSLLWRFAILPALARGGPAGAGTPLWVSLAGLVPNLVQTLAWVTGGILWCMVSRRRPGQPPGGTMKLVVCLALLAIYAVLSMAGQMLMGIFYYRLQSGSRIVDIRWLLQLNSLCGWVAGLICLLLLTIGILFMFHIGARRPSRPLGVVGAVGLGLVMIVFIGMFTMTSIYLGMTLGSGAGGVSSFIDFYRKALPILSATQSVIVLIFMPTLAGMALVKGREAGAA